MCDLRNVWANVLSKYVCNTHLYCLHVCAGQQACVQGTRLLFVLCVYVTCKNVDMNVYGMYTCVYRCRCYVHAQIQMNESVTYICET